MYQFVDWTSDGPRNSIIGWISYEPNCILSFRESICRFCLGIYVSQLYTPSKSEIDERVYLQKLQGIKYLLNKFIGEDILLGNFMKELLRS